MEKIHQHRLCVKASTRYINHQKFKIDHDVRSTFVFFSKSWMYQIYPNFAERLRWKFALLIAGWTRFQVGGDAATP